jgi:hypothetical protein
MSSCGGSTSRDLIDNEIPEVTPSGAPVWTGRASDHIPFAEVSPPWQEECTTGAGDIYHWNSIESDGAGYVLSCRHRVYRRRGDQYGGLQ